MRVESLAKESRMKNVVWCMLVLVLVGLIAVPVFAAELRTTGFIDNSFPHWERNISNPGSDNDATLNHDTATYGRTRGRMFFNFIASDDLRGVFGIELDAIWGLPRVDRAGAGCVVGDGAYGSENCGFQQNN